MTKRLLVALILLFGVSLSAAVHGPDKGTLVIVGGNMQDPAIVNASSIWPAVPTRRS